MSTGDEELLDYINALLQEGHNSVPEKSKSSLAVGKSGPPVDKTPAEALAVSQPKTFVQTEKPLPNEQQQAEELRLLELEKRNKLQQLLSSRPVTIAEEKPKPAPASIKEEAASQSSQKPVQNEVRAVKKVKSETAKPEPAVIADPLAEAGHQAVAEQIQRQEQTPAYMEWNENGRPEWAQNAFDVLLFKVSGLSLAVPLVSLGHIHTLDEQLTPIFGQVNWFIGLQPSPAGQVKVVNTALFVMPERYSEEFLKTMKYVVTIDGLDWGLAVDDVKQPVKLQPSDVTWRSTRTKRPWLAGTVKSAMCALIDIPNMGKFLEKSQTKSSQAKE